MNKVKKYFIFPAFLIAVLLFLFGSFKQDSFQKMKTLTEIIRLVHEVYIEEPDMNSLMEGAIEGLLSKLDPHSTYIPQKDFSSIQESFQGDFEGIGIEFAIMDGYITVISPIPGTPSDRAGLISGDQIIKINGKSAYKISQDDVLKKLKGPKGTPVDVTIRRKGAEDFNITLIRDKIPIHSVLASFMIDEKTGYIKLNRFSGTSYNEINDAMYKLESIGMKQLLLDLRGNPGGMLDQAVMITDMFISSRDTIVSTKGRIYQANDVFIAKNQAADKKIPIVVLINQGSASASEIVSGALQDLDRGIVVGETSFGKGLVQRQFQLRDGSAARITIAQYFTPSGRLIQRPYDDGLDSYYLNDAKADSIERNRPQFKTKKGRTVYGGGGITPDIIVENERTFSKSSREILFDSKRPIFNYANYIIANKKGQIKKQYSSINQSIFKKDEFYDWLNKHDYKFESSELDEDWDFLLNRILAEICNNLLGKEFYFKKLNEEDIQIKESIKAFKKAKKLISNK